jgi:hypothetical protein
MTSLDMSQNPGLQWLSIGNTSIRSLNISKNPELKFLYTYQSSLQSLDVSKNPALEFLGIYYATSIRELNLRNNPMLRELVIGWSYGRITELDVTNNPLLEVLRVDDHHLTSMDLTKNTLLREVSFSNDDSGWTDPRYRISTLDISKNPLLESLIVDNQKLTSLNASNNPKLIRLIANNNNLTSINVSNSHELAVLNVGNNQLTSLNVSGNYALAQLITSHNQIAVLDLTNNSKLGTEKQIDIGGGWALIYYGLIWANDNKLTKLDISNTAPVWSSPTIRLNVSNNYIPALSNVTGWQVRNMVLGDNFIFEPQHISSIPVIITATLPNGKAGTIYSQKLVATGGGITWSISGVSLPDGLTLDSAGTLTGIPLAHGTFVFTVTASNETGSTSVTYTLMISYSSIDGVIVWITNAEQLAAIGNQASVDKYYILANDIYLNKEWVPINNFRGVLDGRGHTIHNLYVLQSSGRMGAGLFGSLDDTYITIKNLIVNLGPQGVTASYPGSFNAFAGGLVGYIYRTLLNITNCHVEGAVTAVSTGASGSVGQGAGGLVGSAFTSEITVSTSSAAGSVTIRQGSFDTAGGGLIGVMSNPLTISNSYATNNVTVGDSSTYIYGGGLIGAGGGIATITNSYATGNVTVNYGHAGGISGNTPSASAKNTYRLSSQVITGSTVNSFGTPLTKEQMQRKTSFVGWDFDNVWAISESFNGGLPYLRALWKLPQVEAPDINIIDVIFGKEAWLSCSTDGAAIYATIDGTDPDRTSQLVTPNLYLQMYWPETLTIKAIAVKDGFRDSAISGKTVTIVQAPRPTANPAPGIVPIGSNVTLTATDFTEIHYTTNGIEPSISSPKSPLTITINSATLIKAVNYRTGMAASDTVTLAYTVVPISASLERIELVPPIRRVYPVGAPSLDLTGLVVTGFYSDNTSKIENEYSVTGFSSSAPARSQIITVAIGEVKATFTVDIRTSGDVDGDGMLTFTDLMLILDHVEGKNIITNPYILDLVDVDGDKIITFTDLMRLLMIIEGS